MQKLFPYDTKIFRYFLYSHYRGLAIEDLFQGIIDGAAMFPREAIKPCLGQKAAPVNLGSKLPIEGG